MPKIPLATRKNASLSLAAFLVIATAWWYSQQPSAPPPPPPIGDTTVVVDPPDTTTPPVACALTGGTGNAASSTCQPCQYTPPGPNTASIDPSCVVPPPATCSLIGGSGAPGSGTCVPCGYNPPGASYATGAAECVAPPPPQVCELHYGSGTVGSSTCQPCPYNPPGQSFATQAPTCKPAPPDTTTAPPDTTTAPPTTTGPATIAELPRSSPAVVYPTGLTTQTVVPNGANLQTYINAATPGTELLLTPGAVYVGNFILPDKGAGQSWIVIRTNTSMPVITSRMTPAVAASKNLASVCTNNTSPALATAPSAHHYWISGVKICGQAGFNGGNILIRLGDSGGNGQTSTAVVPHHITIERSWVTVLPTVNVRRNILANSAQTLIYSNYIENCHDGGGDSQCILGYNGTKELRIENNDLIGAHEIVMMGGADPANSSLQPMDVILRGNHIWRPASWKSSNPGTSTYGAGQWPVKNLIETKDVIRYLIENNVFENDWSDAQQYAFNFKSENQNCSASYTQTADLTFRYNLIKNVGSGWNLSGKQGACAAVNGARFTITNNWIQSGFNTSPYNSTGNVLQVLGGLSDLIFAHNTISNPSGTNALVSMDGGANPNLTMHSNIAYKGTYGVKGNATSEGNPTLTVFAPSALFQYNVLIGANCGIYPATNFCPSSFPTTFANGYDGKPVGADTAAVLAKTAGVVVAATPSTSILILPGQSIQSVVNAYPTGQTFILGAGTHVQQSVIPKDSTTFRGEPGAILDGQNVTQFAFKGWTGSRWVNAVKLVNFTITKYASPAQNGAVYGGDDLANATNGWILDSMEVSNSANIGIRIGNHMQIVRSNLHHNGTINIGGVGRGVLVDGITAAYGNNGCPNNPGFESGGSKFVLTDSLIVRNSDFSNNCGVGLWLDISNINYQLYNNTVTNNIREGIVAEISFGGKIYNNTVSNNGWGTDPFRANGWLWDAGIGVHESKDVEVYGNTLNENLHGIVIIQQKRDSSTGDTFAPTGGYLAQNVYIHNNTIYQRTTGSPDGDFAAGAAQDVAVGDTAIFTLRNNRFQNNTYYTGTNTSAWAWKNGARTKTVWQGVGFKQDTTGVFNP